MIVISVIILILAEEFSQITINITSDFCSSSNDSEMELLKDDSIYKEEIVDAQLEHSEESVQSNLPITENEISMMSIEARFRLLINETSR